MAAILTKFLVRILTYFLGIMVVLALAGMGVFVLAHPQIDDFVTTEIKKRGVEVESWDLGFNGRANLHAARMTLPGGVDVRAALISARPPIAGFSGSATLYDVRITRGEISFTIPELDISGISQRENDGGASSRLVQLLQRFDIDEIVANEAFLNIADSENAVLKLGRLMGEDIGAGKIGRLRFERLDSQINKINGRSGEESLHVDTLDVHDIDIEAALNIFAGQAKRDDQAVASILGNVRLNDVKFEGNISAKPLSVTLGNLTSDGLTLKSIDIIPLDLLRSFLMAQREGASDEEKKQTREKLWQLLEMFEAVDVRLNDVELKVPNATVKFQSFILQADDWAFIFPEKFDFKLEGLIFDIVDQPEDIAQLLNLTGYNRVEASASMTAQLDREGKSLILKDLSLNAQNMGDFFLSFQFDNVDMRPLIEEGEYLKDWLQTLRLHDFSMGVRDRGIVGNFATIIAGIGGVESEEISQDLEDMARQAPSILFEDSTLAASTEEALLAFLRQSGLLRLQIASKTGDGFELKQIMGDEVDWQSILAIADIRISHEKDNTNPG